MNAGPRMKVFLFFIITLFAAAYSELFYVYRRGVFFASFILTLFYLYTVGYDRSGNPADLGDVLVRGVLNFIVLFFPFSFLVIFDFSRAAVFSAGLVSACIAFIMLFHGRYYPTTYFALTLKDLPDEPGDVVWYVVYDPTMRKSQIIFSGSMWLDVGGKMYKKNEAVWEILKNDPSLLELI